MINDLYRSQFRLPYPIYERLKAEADAQKRSLNAEINIRLAASLEADEDPVARLAQLLDERDARMLDEVRTTIQQLLGVGVGDAKK